MTKPQTTDQTTDQTTEQAAPQKTVIRPNLKNYVPAKSSAGKRSHRIDDLTARCLDGKSLEQIKTGADLLGIDHGKWSHLNNGQQRMLIGNKVRAMLSAKKDPITEDAVIQAFGEPAAPYDAEAAAAKAEKEAAKAAAKAEKEAAAARAAEAAAARAAEAESTGEASEASEGSSTHRSSGKSRKSK